MNKLTGYLPALAILLLTIPFLLLLIGIRSNGFDPSLSPLWILNFVFTDNLYAQAIGYLQAPIVLAIVLRYHSPAAQSISGNDIIKWPNNLSTWILVGICAAAIVIAYLARYTFAAEDCAKNVYCETLSEDLDIVLAKTPRGVSPELQAYCSALIAGAIAVLTAIFVGTPEKKP